MMMMILNLIQLMLDKATSISSKLLLLRLEMSLCHVIHAFTLLFHYDSTTTVEVVWRQKE